jgi:hypothetical protein
VQNGYSRQNSSRELTESNLRSGPRKGAEPLSLQKIYLNRNLSSCESSVESKR